MNSKTATLNSMKVEKANSLFQSVVDPQNFFLNIKINDLGTTVRVGLFESSFEEVTDIEAVTVSSETATY